MGYKGDSVLDCGYFMIRNGGLVCIKPDGEVVDMEEQSERSWIITGFKIGKYWFGKRRMCRVGSHGEVTFDHDWVLKRDEAKFDVLGWHHTHPSNCDAYVSPKDLGTMQAWSLCLGKPLLCLITGDNGLLGWVFEDSDSLGVPLSYIKLLGDFVVGVE